MHLGSLELDRAAPFTIRYRHNAVSTTLSAISLPDQAIHSYIMTYAKYLPSPPANAAQLCKLLEPLKTFCPSPHHAHHHPILPIHQSVSPPRYPAP